MIRILSTIFCLLTILWANAQNLHLQNQPLLAQAQINNLPQSGLVAWWKADSIPSSTANGTPMGNTTNGTTWIDSSGNGHDLTQNVVASRPVYHTGSAGIFGGLNCVDFTTSGFALNLASAVTLSNFTILSVVKYAGVSTDGILIGSLSLNRQVRRQQNILRTFDGSGEAVSNPVFVSTTNGYLTVFKRTFTNITFMACTNLAFVMWPTNDPIASLVLDDLGASPPSGVGTLQGFLAEMAIYNYEMDTNQVISVYTNYFKPKWRLVN